MFLLYPNGTFGTLRLAHIPLSGRGLRLVRNYTPSKLSIDIHALKPAIIPSNLSDTAPPVKNGGTWRSNKLEGVDSKPCLENAEPNVGGPRR